MDHLFLVLNLWSGLRIIFYRLAAVLHQKTHGHSHGFSKKKKTELKKPKASPSSFIIEEEAENVNVRAAFIHVLGDFLQSVGVFLAALLIWFKVSLIRSSIRSTNRLDTKKCFSRLALLDALSTGNGRAIWLGHGIRQVLTRIPLRRVFTYDWDWNGYPKSNGHLHVKYMK